jgi:hypothetical protein
VGSSGRFEAALTSAPPCLPVFTIIREVLKDEGVGGLWKGFGAGLLTYGPFVGTYFVCYEQFKVLSKRVSGTRSEKDLPLPYFLSSGAAGGAIAAAVTCPLDVIETRMQIESSSNRTYSTIRGSFNQRVQTEGYRGLWKGFSARICWIAPSCALTLAACKSLPLKVLLLYVLTWRLYRREVQTGFHALHRSITSTQPTHQTSALVSYGPCKGPCWVLRIIRTQLLFWFQTLPVTYGCTESRGA